MREKSAPLPLAGAPAALVVGHPGHELRVHGWLERARPLVFVLTDGSGRGEVGRLSSTAAVLRSSGARPGSVFGRWRDRDIYGMLLQGDVADAAAVVEELAGCFSAEGIVVACSDRLEGFNPVHDVCRLVLDEVGALLARRGRTIPSYDFPLAASPLAGASTPGDVLLTLDDAALERKLGAARSYPELAGETAWALERYGAEAFRFERLRPVAPDSALAELTLRPEYERHGRERVAAGHYRDVLTAEDHFLPFAAALRAALRPAGDC